MICKRGFFPAINNGFGKIPIRNFGHPVLPESFNYYLDLGDVTFTSSPYYKYIFKSGTSLQSSSNSSNLRQWGFSRKNTISGLYFDKTECDLTWASMYDYTTNRVHGKYDISYDQANSEDTDVYVILRYMQNAIQPLVQGMYVYQLIDGIFSKRPQGSYSCNTPIIVDDTWIFDASSQVSGTNGAIKYVRVDTAWRALQSGLTVDFGSNTSHNVKIGFENYISSEDTDYSSGRTTFPDTWVKVSDV